MLRQKEIINDWAWDVLIVLDACRFDFFEKHALPVLPKGELYKAWSEGSCTPEWFLKTFTRDYYDWVYVSGNPFISSYPVKVEGLDFADKVYAGGRFYKVVNAHDIGWSKVNNVYTVKPSVVTSLARVTLKTIRGKRIIVHYLQPHAPYVFIPQLRRYWKADKTKMCINLWDALRKKEVDVNLVIEGYKRNLLWVLGYVRKLLEDTRGKRVIITSDHGEAFGEWFTFNHPPGAKVPVLREVPVYVIQP